MPEKIENEEGNLGLISEASPNPIPTHLVGKTNAEIDAIVASQELERLRQERNYRLSRCDWTQANDSPLTNTKKTEWATYRTALRDITNSGQTLLTVTFPTEPS